MEGQPVVQLHLYEDETHKEDAPIERKSQHGVPGMEPGVQTVGKPKCNYEQANAPGGVARLRTHSYLSHVLQGCEARNVHDSGPYVRCSGDEDEEEEEGQACQRGEGEVIFLRMDTAAPGKTEGEGGRAPGLVGLVVPLTCRVLFLASMFWMGVVRLDSTLVEGL